jgi:DNA helicase-2/ATP-dependent DNA helicase PcrA
MEDKLTFNEFLKKSLNEPQKMAVKSQDPATLVVAGAGSGKTRVITARIADLILNRDADPSSIVALTFTNKAAGEMKERIASFLGTTKKVPFVGTFHSYCLLLLRRNASLLPFPDFSIIDSDDQLAIIRKIITKNVLTKYITASQACYQLSTYKNSLLAKQTDEPVPPFIKDIHREYETEKSAAHCLDFDDLLIQGLSLFSKNSDFREIFQRRVRHLLVDEYQDTSVVQHQLLQYMALDGDKKFAIESLCAVGDEDQSIYSWRGATVANMLSFQRDFSPVSVIKIEQNYRSVQPILEAANRVIDNNRLRNPKTLWSIKKAKDRILVGHCRSGEQEASAIARFIQSFTKDEKNKIVQLDGLGEKKKLSDIAILYRTHFQSRQIEEALIYHSIPYKIVGGLQFYERKEIKDLLAYMRVIVNPFDKISLFRAINCPGRGLGPKFEEDLSTAWIQEPMLDFKQILKSLKNSQPMGKQISITDFLRVFDGLDSSMSPAKIIELILKNIDYFGYLRQNYDPREADAKIENVKEFLVSAQMFERKVASYELTSFTPDGPPDDPFCDSSITMQPSLENYLYEIALLQEKLQQNENDDKIQMMTLHAAKGLEFDAVIIAGLDEGLLPSSRSLNVSEALEEERRLFYVGITRAQEYLLLFSASYRNSYGQIVEQVASRFLSEIPSKLVHKVDFEKMLGLQISETIEAWMFGKELANSVMTFSNATHSNETFSNATYSNRSSSSTRSPRPQASRSMSKSTVRQLLKPAKINQPARGELVEPSPNGRRAELQKFEAFSSGTWKNGGIIEHKKFGQGVIIKVEKTTHDFYLTVAFKCGQKKLLASYVSKADV